MFFTDGSSFTAWKIALNKEYFHFQEPFANNGFSSFAAHPVTLSVDGCCRALQPSFWCLVFPSLKEAPFFPSLPFFITNKNIDRGLNEASSKHTSVKAHVLGCGGENRNLRQPFPASLPSSWMSPTHVETLGYRNGAWKERICFWGCLAALVGYLSSEGLPEQNQGSWALSDHLGPSHITPPPPPSANLLALPMGSGLPLFPFGSEMEVSEELFNFSFGWVAEMKSISAWSIWKCAGPLPLKLLCSLSGLCIKRIYSTQDPLIPPQTCLAQDLWAHFPEMAHSEAWAWKDWLTF